MLYLAVDEMVRKAAKVDSNELVIVGILQREGCIVSRVCGRGADINSGFPDLVVSYQRGSRRETILIEIKDGDKAPSRQKLRPNQEEFRRKWKGRIYVVTNEDEALEAIELKRG